MQSIQRVLKDEDRYFPSDLASKRILEVLERIPESLLSNVLERVQSALLTGQFFIGTDLGKKRDYSAIAVIRKDGDILKLVFMKRFKLGSEYGAVMGAIRVLCEKLNMVQKICVDQTGAEFFVEDLKKVVHVPVEGIMLTVPSKQEVLGYLRTIMQAGQLYYPYDEDLLAEITVERYELMKSGQIQFSHPDGTHDDRLWALALAVYAARGAVPPGRGVVILNPEER